MSDQQPVAWAYVNTDGECEQIDYGPSSLSDMEGDIGIIPLYTRPAQPTTPAPLPFTKTSAHWKGKTMTDDLVERYRDTMGLTRDGAIRRIHVCLDRIETQDKLLAKQGVLIERLHGYARHKQNCVLAMRLGGPCTCGLATLLASIKE